MSILQRYQTYVFRTIGHEPAAEADLDHWRDRVFGTVLTYGLPLSLVALVPGIYAAWVEGLHFLVAYDVVAMALLILITIVPGMSMGMRKGICIFVFYGIAVVLLYYLGNHGPGLLFMVAASVFSILFYQLRYALLYQLLNVCICLFFLFLILYADGPVPLREHHNALSWFAVSSNMIFISAVLVLLLHHILNGLQHAIEGQQRSREAAERSNKQLGHMNSDLEEFAYVASHDLQEPLRMVTSFLDLLRKHLGTSLDDKAKEYMHFAHDGASRMRTTILDLLEFARAGRVAEPQVSVDILALMRSVERDMGPAIDASGGQMHYDGPATLILARATLRQVVQNLLGNALKYRSADKPPVIKITAEVRAELVHFSVTDNGIGIDPKFHERIFRMLQRLHSREEYAGTGMGLAICKRVIEQTGGTIWVRSEVGKGSTFHFTMPTRVQ